MLGFELPTASDSGAEVTGSLAAGSMLDGNGVAAWWFCSMASALCIILSIRSNLSRLPAVPSMPTAVVAADSTVAASYDDEAAVAPHVAAANRDKCGATQHTLQSVISRLWQALAVKPGPFEIDLCRILGQHQQWFLFDVPSRDDYWFVSVGHCVDGSRMDVFGSLFASTTRCGAPTILQPVLTSPPPPWEAAYRSHRWRKMLARLAESKYSRLRPAYAAYIAGAWNSIAPSEGKHVQALEMRCVRRKIDVVHRSEAAKIPVTEIDAANTTHKSVGVVEKGSILLWRCGKGYDDQCLLPSPGKLGASAQGQIRGNFSSGKLKKQT